MSAVTGTDQLAQLRERLLKIKGVAVEVAKTAAPILSLQTQADFMARRDPYGDPWPKSAARNGLIRTGRLRGRIGFRWDGGTWVRTRSFPKYARYQNPRLFIVSRSLPGPYRGAIDKAFVAYLKKQGFS